MDDIIELVLELAADLFADRLSPKALLIALGGLAAGILMLVILSAFK